MFVKISFSALLDWRQPSICLSLVAHKSVDFPAYYFASLLTRMYGIPEWCSASVHKLDQPYQKMGNGNLYNERFRIFKNGGISNAKM